MCMTGKGENEMDALLSLLVGFVLGFLLGNE